ncbi:low molecular weight phosphatase family protein [Demequina sp.]|uniref:arsenate reductase/protein-tyrosine-phosphatase family protein n=1 Tax=Demequina sp. TaxID=2050685 RepID=UPI003D10FFCC
MTRIITVCTGNICRSPAAELLLASAFSSEASVSSAGTHAMVGHGIPASMLMCLDGDGIDGRGHVARQYSASLAREADLVVCMSARHRTWAVSEAPFALRRTFLLTELQEAARLGAPLEGGLAGVAQAVSDFRPSLAGRVMADVPDPYMESQAVYDASYAMIRTAVSEIAQWVRSSL